MKPCGSAKQLSVGEKKKKKVGFTEKESSEFGKPGDILMVTSWSEFGHTHR